MSKNVMISDEAYAALSKHKRTNENFSDVIKRLAPPPIETFGDSEKYLDNLEAPLNLDFESLERIRRRKRLRSISRSP
jgi:hypothetical protein